MIKSLYSSAKLESRLYSTMLHTTEEEESLLRLLYGPDDEEEQPLLRVFFGPGKSVIFG